jgi:hypothetical protein
MKKYGIAAAIITGLMLVTHLLVNNFGLLDSIKRMHGG